MNVINGDGCNDKCEIEENFKCKYAKNEKQSICWYDL